MWRALALGTVLVAGWCAAAAAQPSGPKGQLNTLADVGRALRACWQWPPMSEARSGMELTLLISFKRDGEIFGARITYESPNVSDDERAIYHGALLAALTRCARLPLSDSLGGAIAGRPLRFHIHDTRQERKV